MGMPGLSLRNFLQLLLVGRRSGGRSSRGRGRSFRSRGCRSFYRLRGFLLLATDKRRQGDGQDQNLLHVKISQENKYGPYARRAIIQKHKITARWDSVQKDKITLP